MNCKTPGNPESPSTAGESLGDNFVALAASPMRVSHGGNLWVECVIFAEAAVAAGGFAGITDLFELALLYQHCQCVGISMLDFRSTPELASTDGVTFGSAAGSFEPADDPVAESVRDENGDLPGQMMLPVDEGVETLSPAPAPAAASPAPAPAAASPAPAPAAASPAPAVSQDVAVLDDPAPAVEVASEVELSKLLGYARKATGGKTDDVIKSMYIKTLKLPAWEQMPADVCARQIERAVKLLEARAASGK